MSDEPRISVMVVDDHPIWRDGVARDLSEHGLDVMAAAASGYLVKSASAAELVDAVHRTAAGDPVFTAGLAGLVLGEYRRMADAPAEGAEPLVLSHRTVENHVQSTLRKLQLHNRVELARYAIEHGLDGD